MKRLLSIALVSMVVLGVLAGCAGGSGASEELSAAEVGERIEQAVSLDDMKQGDLEKLQQLYHIEPEQVDDFVLFTAESNVKADELAIIKVKDANEVDIVLNNIRQRIEAQAAKFQNYRPEEYFLVEKHVLKAQGRFIIFAVTEESARVEEEFGQALK
ncbi:DUF4358 domain-containing protein [Paenibacillus senegalensis]|uniref:DUF4358 domain-containing protein n=1 Tax=Paenibacillus senegalensis TaxID=1465766 RepID=UPI000289409E|nr:DUF4358 domain-containing protein [Paenibacillus senegalensis]